MPGYGRRYAATNTMKQSHTLSILFVVSIFGCYRSIPSNPVASSVEVTDASKAMVGNWGVGGEPTLLIKLNDDNVELSVPSNDTWRIEIHDARLIDDSIHFVQKHYLHSGEYHPFNGVACHTIAKRVGEGMLQLEMTTAQSEDLPADILTRIE